MGDIASLNINGVTYGLKDEVARSGGGGGSVLGYGQFGQFCYIDNKITLTKTSTYKELYNLQGSGALYGLGFGWFASGISSSTLNYGVRVLIDGHDLVNATSSLSLNSSTYNAYRTLSIYSNYRVTDATNNIRPEYGWNVQLNISGGSILFNNTINALPRSMPKFNNLPQRSTVDVNLMTPVIFHNNLVIDYYITCTKSFSTNVLGLAVIGTTFQP